jgi:hypothetical protein
MQLRESIRTATIAINGQTSNAIPLRGRMVVGMRIPSAFTGTTITFTASEVYDGTYAAVYDSDNNQVSVAVGVSRFIGLNGAEADAVSAAPFVKLVSGSAEAAAREVEVVLK